MTGMRGWLIAMVMLTGCRQILGIDEAVVVGDGGTETVDSSGVGQRITFDHGAGLTELAEFPVRLRLDPGRVAYGRVTDPMTGLHFVSSEGATLPFDVEAWVPGGESNVWVKVPRIGAGSITDYIEMRYEASGAAYAPMDVWTTHELVSHMGPGFANAAGLGAGVSTNVNVGAGQIASGASLVGGSADQRITFVGSEALFNRWPTFTLELWLRPTYTSGVPGGPQVLEKEGSLAARLHMNGNAVDLDVDIQTAQPVVHPSARVSATAWSQITITYDGSFVRMFRDGLLVTQDTATGLIDPSMSNPFVLGKTSSAMMGGIDEVRVSMVPRSPTWIAAQYRSMIDQFATFSGL